MHSASILLLVAGFFGVLFVGRMVGRCFRPLTVLGVAAILGGLAVFGGRGATHVTHVHSDRWAPAEERLIDDEISAHEQPPILWRSESEQLTIIGAGLKHMSAKKWVLISLGTVLVITGALLAGRGRARPVVLKAFTVLGLAAASYALVTFVTSTPRHTWDNNGDRIVKNDRTVRIGVDSRNDDEPSPPPTPPKKPKRPARAKRPTSRPERHESTEELITKMPPRAGEIPVADELAKVAAKAEPTSELATPPSPAAESAPVDSAPAAEPTKAPEPVASADPIKAPEQAKAAEQSPTPEPPKAAETTDVSEPVTNSTSPTSSATAPVAASSTRATASKPAVQLSPLSSPPVIAGHQSAAERPAWVDAPGKLVDSVYRVSVNSGPYVTVPECQRTLDSQMKHVANQYVDDYLGEGASDVVDIPLRYLRKHVKKAEFNEVIESETVGPMQQIHALLEFDDEARADFQHRWHNAVVGRRLWHVGASTGLVLALLGTLYGYLRLDLRTGGTHKGQLQLAAALVALIVTAGALLVQSKLPF